MKITYLLAAVSAVAAVPASADITVDGTRDAAYGSAQSSVTYNPAAPTSNFDAPTPFSDASSYDICLTSDANSVFGFIQSDRVTPVKGANFTSI